ncbi:MAG TPA: glycosyltransferase family A protein, partial [Dehalococcoidia bacterium]|nr:glycosyltransferase family A protein [Dehalococcoidia bacterium]
MLDTPDVSVIIPTKNRAHLLPEALCSALSAATQAASLARTEIIVIDDGSADDTARVALQFPIRYMSNQGSGIDAARNTGIAAAHGRYIGFLDDDDVWLDCHLTRHLLAHRR